MREKKTVSKRSSPDTPFTVAEQPVARHTNEQYERLFHECVIGAVRDDRLRTTVGARGAIHAVECNTARVENTFFAVRTPSQVDLARAAVRAASVALARKQSCRSPLHRPILAEHRLLLAPNVSTKAERTSARLFGGDVGARAIRGERQRNTESSRLLSMLTKEPACRASWASANVAR